MERSDDGDADAFTKAAEQRQRGIVSEYLAFIQHNRKWWMLPIVLVLMLVAALVILGGTPVGPFVYTLF